MSLNWDHLPRRAGVIIHHPVASWDATTDWTVPTAGNGDYDFQINRNANWNQIIVGYRATYNTGAHSRGCNCDYQSIALQGCFGDGGTSAGLNDPPSVLGGVCATHNANVSPDLIHGWYPSGAQRCGSAYILHHLGIPKNNAKLLPHQWCKQENPCNGNINPSKCPGTLLQKKTSPTTYYWRSGGGMEFRDDVIAKAKNIEQCGSCVCS